MEFVENIRVLGKNYLVKDCMAIHDEELPDKVADSDDIKATVQNWILDTFYPVGSLYVNFKDDINPGEFMGGVWQRVANGRAIVGYDPNDSDFDIGVDNGNKTVSLTIDNLPAHSHTVGTHNGHTHLYQRADAKVTFRSGTQGVNYTVLDGSSTVNTQKGGDHTHSISTTGKGVAFNNLMPYKVGYAWERVE